MGKKDSINIGIVGAGVVGGGVVTILDRRLDYFHTRLNLPLKLARIADKQTGLFADLPVGQAQCSASADDILADASIDIVVELVGGTGYARELILAALGAGKHVVTANKALIAEHGPELFEAAQRSGVSIWFEASTGGGMPAIKTIREAMVGNRITSVKTIINGTCNYILTCMTGEARSFADVLKDAQAQGFAEADPTLDIGGGDTGHKVAIMASLIHDGYVPYEDIYIEGITGIEAEDIAVALELGYRIKLIGHIARKDGGALDVRVHPMMLHGDHILASVSNEFNAVLLDGDAVGQILLYGKGAGRMPTASAVVGDIVDIARNLMANAPLRIPMNAYSAAKRLDLLPMDEVTTRYYLRFSVVDRPGVLASIARVLGDNGISIASVMQKEGITDAFVPVIILTHRAKEMNLRAALQTIENEDYVKDRTRLIRIED